MLTDAKKKHLRYNIKCKYFAFFLSPDLEDIDSCVIAILRENLYLTIFITFISPPGLVISN